METGGIELMCCKLSCQRLADVAIVSGPMPDDMTYSCLRDIPDMLTDAQEHYLYWVRPQVELADIE